MNGVSVENPVSLCTHLISGLAVVLQVGHTEVKYANLVSPSSTDAGIHSWQMLHPDTVTTELRRWVSF